MLLLSWRWDNTTSFLWLSGYTAGMGSVYAAWGLPKPSSVSNMFGNWLNGIPKDYKPLDLVGAAALCWFVWRCGNVVVLFITMYIFACELSSRLHISYEHELSYNSLLRRTPLWRRRIFWPRWPKTFLLGCMGASLVLGLTVINVLGFYQKLFCRVVCH